MNSEVDTQERVTPLYVIGFPKSGNTWLARLLADITSSKIDANGPSDVVNGADNGPDRNGRYVIRKVHYVADIDQLRGQRFVYIVRDVRDVLVSGFFHCNRWATDKDFSSSPLLKYYFRHEVLGLNKKWQGSIISRSIASVRVALQKIRGRRPHAVGNWSAHVERWTRMDGAIVVKYEDLLENTEKVFLNILDELSINASDADIRSVLEKQDFANRKREFEKTGDAVNLKFMRSGRAGDWARFLSGHVLAAIEMRHGEAMKRMGYNLHSNQKKSFL